MEMVKCEICGEVMTVKDAFAHVNKTGHNSWTLRPVNDITAEGRTFLKQEERL